MIDMNYDNLHKQIIIRRMVVGTSNASQSRNGRTAKHTQMLNAIANYPNQHKVVNKKIRKK